ncbi:MAG: superoxide dismutase [Candidatus Pelagibacter sp.]|nr:superoxide dismutase [Candidatus Pelagibacter sp.]|tara:strand:- start:14609 stop:15205 length:597 start_codon:yes stop_codon:yes gene_type:complete
MTFQLPKLDYSKSSLSPHMSEETLDLHHGKHHQTYITNLNNLIKDSVLENSSLEEIVKKTSADPSKIGIFNNAGQHWNHILFWKCMKPKGGGALPGKLEKRINSDFGGVDKFKEQFIQAGVTQFGSGWAWLAIDDKGKLVVTKTANASNPLVNNMKPILGCDVWEHSYYVDYRNRRPDYLKSFIENLVNWEFVESQLD